MSPGLSIPYTGSLMTEIQCDCGNLISYDDIDSSGDFPAYTTLKCESCGREHRIILDGELGNLKGAKRS